MRERVTSWFLYVSFFSLPFFVVVSIFGVRMTTTEILLSLGILIWGVRMRKQLSAIWRTPLFAPLLSISFIALVGASVVARDHAIAYREAIQLLWLFALYVFLFRAVGSQERVVRLLIVTSVSAVIISVVGLYQYTFLEEPRLFLINEQRMRAFGTFGQPNAMGAFIINVILIMVGLCGATEGKKRWLAGVAVYFMSMALFATFSRGSWAGMGCGLVAVLGMLRGRLPVRAVMPALLGVFLAGMTMTADAYLVAHGSLVGEASAALHSGGGVNDKMLERPNDPATDIPGASVPSAYVIDSVNNVQVHTQPSPIRMNVSRDPIMRLKGWAVDYEASDAAQGVTILLDQQPVAEADYGKRRPDVAQALDNEDYLLSGWEADVSLRGLTLGEHIVEVKVIGKKSSSYGGNPVRILLGKSSDMGQFSETATDKMAPRIPNEPSVKVPFTNRRTDAERIELALAALRMFRAHPFLGVGPGNYQTLLRQYAGRGVLAEDHMREIEIAHNSVLQIAAEMGLLGIAAFLWLAWRYVRLLLQRLRVSSRDSEYFLRAGLAGGVVASMAAGMFGWPFTHGVQEILMVAVAFSVAPWKSDEHS